MRAERRNKPAKTLVPISVGEYYRTPRTVDCLRTLQSWTLNLYRYLFTQIHIWYHGVNLNPCFTIWIAVRWIYTPSTCKVSGCSLQSNPNDLWPSGWGYRSLPAKPLVRFRSSQGGQWSSANSDDLVPGQRPVHTKGE